MKKYKDDYEIITTADEKGREKQTLHYRGTYYAFENDEADLSRIKMRSFMLVATIVLLHIGSGYLRNQGMYQLYISIPYVFSFLALWYLAYGILRMPTKKQNYRRDEIELTLNRAKTASKTLLVLLGLIELGELIFLIFGPETVKYPVEFLYMALNALSITLLYFLVRLLARITIKQIQK